MKKYILPLLAMTTLVATFSFTSEDKPKVSLRQAEEGVASEDNVGLALQTTRERVAELAHNDAVTLKNYDALAEVLNAAYHKEKSMTADEIEEVCAGIDFAAEKHRLQTRKNKAKTPYISHPIAVAYHLMYVGEVREAPIIIGALLHDTVEDTQTTYEEIEKKFGGQIASLVREVTSDKSLGREARKRMEVINATHHSKGAAQIRLADKLNNLNDLLMDTPQDWTQARVDRYYEWAQSVVDRLPKANTKLYDAVEKVINQYWEDQAAVKKS